MAIETNLDNKPITADSLIQTWQEEDLFLGWSEQQLKVFQSDLDRNLSGGLTCVEVNDIVIKSCPTLFGVVEYQPATVKAIDSETGIVTVIIPSSYNRLEKYQIFNGLSIEHQNPNYGWLAKRDSDHKSLEG